MHTDPIHLIIERKERPKKKHFQEGVSLALGFAHETWKPRVRNLTT